MKDDCDYCGHNHATEFHFEYRYGMHDDEPLDDTPYEDAWWCKDCDCNHEDSILDMPIYEFNLHMGNVKARYEEEVKKKLSWCGLCGKIYTGYAIDHVAQFHNPYSSNNPYAKKYQQERYQSGRKPPRSLTEKERKLWAFATQDVSPNERDNAREMLRKKGLWN